jgi:hypothetical protein
MGTFSMEASTSISLSPPQKDGLAMRLQYVAIVISLLMLITACGCAARRSADGQIASCTAVRSRSAPAGVWDVRRGKDQALKTHVCVRVCRTGFALLLRGAERDALARRQAQRLTRGRGQRQRPSSVQSANMRIGAAAADACI